MHLIDDNEANRVGGNDKRYLIDDNEAKRVGGEDEGYLIDDSEANKVGGEDERYLIDDKGANRVGGEDKDSAEPGQPGGAVCCCIEPTIGDTVIMVRFNSNNNLKTKVL